MQKILNGFNKLKHKFDNGEEKKKEPKNSTEYLINELSDKNKFTSKPEEIQNINYYYKPNTSNDNPFLLVAVVAFHHKKGSIIEFIHPNKEEIIQTHQDYLSSLLSNPAEKVIDDILNQLTYFCLPDAVHNTNEDAQFFFIQNYLVINKLKLALQS
jgi:hypothetical protein